jgi:hypothetical protein
MPLLTLRKSVTLSSNNNTKTTPSIKMKIGDQIPFFSLKFLKIAYNYFASFKLQPDGEKN